MDRPNLQEALSQETLISLQQLEPSPVESPLDLEKRLPDLPLQETPPPKPFGLGLSGSNHGAIYYLTRLQRYSSYVFTLYTTFHITNTSLIPLFTRSVPTADRYLLLTRPYYQSPLLEPLLVTLPLLTHISAGLLLRLSRRNASLARYGDGRDSDSHDLSSITSRGRRRHHVWPALSYASIAGYVLTPLVLGHAVVNRVLPWWVEGGSSGVGLAFVSHGFARRRPYPVLEWAAYVALVGVASGHFVWGWAKWMGWAPVAGEGSGSGSSSSNGVEKKRKSRRRTWIINGVAAAVAALWMAGGLGVVARGGKATGWVGKGWDELYARVPLLG